jgi:hypothetical protein
MPVINLTADIYSDEFWTQLFEIINTNFRLNCVEHEGTTFYGLDQKVDEYDEKVSVNEKKLTYKYLGNFSCQDICFDDEVNETIQQICEMKCDPKDIVFRSPQPVIVRNNCGFNHDKRGSDRARIRLPFHKKVNLKKIFSLYEVLVANTKLKSHKFENDYEMYCGASCQRLPLSRGESLCQSFATGRTLHEVQSLCHIGDIPVHDTYVIIFVDVDVDDTVC